MAPPISVLLVDDNPIFLRILTRFLEERSRLEVIVVGSADGGEKALAKAPLLKPQVILVDLAIPDIHGLELIPRLRALMPGARIIALTLMDPGSYREAVMAAGADAFVSKATLETDLLPAIRRLAQGGQFRGVAENNAVSV
ncbi:MAG TPA: response regulator transcription factor [Candidatus Methylomirabilis sp.]|nr:response regulator transcription factor [Candidatus Methylomirabilis sp.]